MRYVSIIACCLKRDRTLLRSQSPPPTLLTLLSAFYLLLPTPNSRLPTPLPHLSQQVLRR
ncbi:MAG: hypothetical protein KME42_14940 [Tildeniella nuda ZEHNDER 1965/U140]|nr:hypothetical protein [Tildeniella nuda ZEHNDER 1965/U140]